MEAYKAHNKTKERGREGGFFFFFFFFFFLGFIFFVPHQTGQGKGGTFIMHMKGAWSERSEGQKSYNQYMCRFS